MDWGNAIIVLVGGGLAGSVLTNVIARLRDRSRPSCDILRISRSTAVPPSAQDLMAQFPPALAAQINNHPALPEQVDASKTIPLRSYLAQVHQFRKAVRIHRDQLDHFREVTDDLLDALNRSAHLRFFDVFAEYNNFLWGYLEGRCKRLTTPPQVPNMLQDISVLKPIVGIQVFTDEDGDFVLQIPGAVRKILLPWSEAKEPARRDRLQRLAAGLAAAIAEFRVDVLRESVGAVATDVDKFRTELAGIFQALDAEEAQYSFLSIAVLLRNRGQRPFFVSPLARCFLASKGYSYGASSGVDAAPAVTVPQDISIDLLLASDHETDDLLEVPAHASRTLKLLSRVPRRQLPNAEAIEKLASAGEREAYVALRLYGDAATHQMLYSGPRLFRSEAPSPELQPRIAR